MNLKQLLNNIDVVAHYGNLDVEVSAIVSDSRKVTESDIKKLRK